MAHVVFLHPDLGIGGAERLVVDANLALKNKGHRVNIITTHHNKNHCFPETKDGTLNVIVTGDWLPRHIFGRFFAVCAYIRMVYAALYLVFFSDLKPDIIFCDLVSICIPFLKLSGSKIIFYCHFPDQLLSPPGNLLKTIYRYPLNVFEEMTTGQADVVLVNSEFTSQVFKRTFKRLNKSPVILYPTIGTKIFDTVSIKPLDNIPSNKITFLSINRYERKKNLELALEAMHCIKNQIESEIWNEVHLVMIGGYDVRVSENVGYFNELVEICKHLEIESNVTFFKSPSDLEKCSLLKLCTCLIYTPSDEHFGIVPVEAMYLKKPVIAVNNGGPTETVVDGETGFLCNAEFSEFANAMKKFIFSKELSKKLGNAGYERVQKKFSFKIFSDNLEQIVQKLQ